MALAALSICSVLLGSNAASAHGVDRPPEGMQPFIEDGELVGAGTSYGLLIESNGDWVWAPTVGIDERSVRAWERAPGADRVLLGSSAGLYSSRDDGCTWSPVDGALGESPVAAFALGQGRSPSIFASTDRADGANAVWRSDDGGATWSMTSLMREDAIFGTVLASDDMVAVGGFERTQATWKVWLSTDGGATWTESPDGMRLAGIRSGELLVAVESDQAWELYAWSGSERGDVLATLEERPEGAGMAGEKLMIWDGERVVDAAGSVRVSGAHCLLSDVTPDSVWLCESTVEDLGGHFLRVGVGGRQSLVAFDDVSPIECPDGSEASEAILERWATLKSQGVGSRDMEGILGDDTGGGCGCDGGAAAVVIVLCLGRVRRIV